MGFSVIIPAYNEEENILNTVEDVKKVVRELDKNAEIIVVDDGSEDKTYDILKKINGIKLIKQETNKGKTTALLTGIKESKYNNILTLDGDGQHPARYIPNLIGQLENYDIVVGSRFLEGFSKDAPMSRTMSNILGAKIASVILGEKITDVSCGMRALNKQLLDSINIKAKNLDFEAELTSRAIANNFKYCEVPITVNERLGNSKLQYINDNYRFLRAILRGKFGSNK